MAAQNVKICFIRMKIGARGLLRLLNPIEK